jgi:diamine N-acetyltransferase
MNIEFFEKDQKELQLIKNLWEKLNKIHADTSPFFSEEYASKSFVERAYELCEKARNGIMKILIARDSDADAIIGYCIYSIINGTGEIESIFVENAYRANSIGDTFLLKADEFFKHNSVSKKHICVYAGNEQVLKFYNRHQYYQKYIVLEKKEEIRDENSITHY